MDKQIGASMDASLFVHVPPDDKLRVALDEIITNANGVDTLRYALVISEVNVVSDIADIKRACGEEYVIDAASSSSGYGMGIKSAKSAGLVKCERCWYFTDDVGSTGCANDLCKRCDGVLKKSGFFKPEQ